MADTLIREGTAFQSQPLAPVPQYWNNSTSSYEKVQGVNGASRVLIYDANGNALLTTANPGKVDIQSALPAGTNNIGDVDVETEPATAADGAASLPSVLKIIAGWDGSNVQAIKTDATGSVQVDVEGALPAGDNNIGNVDIVTVPVVGTHGNAWNAEAVLANGDSTAVDCQYQYRISVFGNADAATTITAYVSQDGTNYYNSGSEQALGGAGDFHFSFETGARYVRLRSSAAATITATIAAKG